MTKNGTCSLFAKLMGQVPSKLLRAIRAENDQKRSDYSLHSEIRLPEKFC